MVLRRSGLQTFLAVLLFSMASTQLSSALPQEKKWSVESVATIKPAGKKVKTSLNISPQTIFVTPAKSASTEIPVAAIDRIGYDESAHSKGWTTLAAIGSAGGGQDAAVVGIPLLIGAAFAAPFKTREHYIRILWLKEGEPQEILLEAGKGDYKDILAELQAVTGKPWHDLPSERQKLREELDQAKNHKIPLQIDRSVLVSGTPLKPGPYQLVLLERGESQGEAYFFSGGEVHPDHVAAQAVVRVDRSADSPNTGSNSHGTAPPELVFGEQACANTLTDLHLPDKTLHFTSPAAPRIAGNAARIFSSGGNRWLIVRRATRNGEPALSFRVVAYGYHKCALFVYVTEMQVTVEPASPGDSHCETLSMPRREVKAEAFAGKWTDRTIELKWKEKLYNCQPLFESADGSGRIPGLGDLRQIRDAARDYVQFFVRAIEDFDAVEREAQSPAAPKTEP